MLFFFPRCLYVCELVMMIASMCVCVCVRVPYIQVFRYPIHVCCIYLACFAVSVSRLHCDCRWQVQLPPDLGDLFWNSRTNWIIWDEINPYYTDSFVPHIIYYTLSICHNTQNVHETHSQKHRICWNRCLPEWYAKVSGPMRFYHGIRINGIGIQYIGFTHGTFVMTRFQSEMRWSC